MTLAPLVSPGIRGAEGYPAHLGKWCVAPGCISLAQQRHHLWPKSYLRGQPYEWVRIDGGKLISNSVGLCMRHHNAVTGMIGGHTAHIRWNEDLQVLEWWELDLEVEQETWLNRGLLKEEGFVPPEPEAAAVRRREQLCPTCGRAKVKHTKPGPKRKAKSWAVMVPDDSEVGTDILDTYIENLGVLMGLDPESPRLLRYHVLVPVLEWVSQNSRFFVADWEEDGTGPEASESLEGRQPRQAGREPAPVRPLPEGEGQGEGSRVARGPEAGDQQAELGHRKGADHPPAL